METKKPLDLQNFTLLPIRQVAVTGNLLPDIFVNTPHRGLVQIKLKKEICGLFSAPRQLDKHSHEICVEIKNLERESIEHLMSEWKSTLK